MRILTICPSIYPEKLDKMLNSYYTTSSTTNLVINSQVGSITTIFNNLFNKYPDFDFYFMANDDIEFKTKDWDKKLANKGKISYGKDNIEGGHTGNFLMIDGDIVRALGWLQMPMLNRYCGDMCWKHIGKQLNILKYMPEVEIVHHWEGCPDLVVNEADMSSFAQWLPLAFRDVERVKKCLI